MRWRSGRNYDWNISIFIHCCFRFANIISFVRYFFRIFRFDELYRYDYVKHVVISLYLTRISNKNDICSASEPIICIRYGFALFQRQSFFSLICFGSFAQISLYLSLFIYSSGKNSNTWKATCCLYVSVSALVFFFARVCLCVCHTFREQKLYLSNTCVCEYAIATRLFCSWNELKPTTLPTLLKMLLDFDLCAHIYIYI